MASMDCPRCDSQLTEIVMQDDGRAVYCEECNFADVESEHTRSRETTETWEDAFSRFYGDDRDESNSDSGKVQSH